MKMISLLSSWICIPIDAPGTRSPFHKKPFHDAVGPVKEHFRTQFLLPSLERGKNGKLNLAEIYIHYPQYYQLISSLEFAEEPYIILEIVAEVLDLPFEHCDTLHSHSECKSAVLLAVYA